MGDGEADLTASIINSRRREALSWKMASESGWLIGIVALGILILLVLYFLFPSISLEPLVLE